MTDEPLQDPEDSTASETDVRPMQWTLRGMLSATTLTAIALSLFVTFVPRERAWAWIQRGVLLLIIFLPACLLFVRIVLRSLQRSSRRWAYAVTVVVLCVALLIAWPSDSSDGPEDAFVLFTQFVCAWSFQAIVIARALDSRERFLRRIVDGLLGRRAGNESGERGDHD